MARSEIGETFDRRGSPGKSVIDHRDRAGDITGKTVVVHADVERAREWIALAVEPVESLEIPAGVRRVERADFTR